MRLVNRHLVITRPKQPYFDWANGVDDTGPRADPADPGLHTTAYLINETDEPEAELRRRFAAIFEENLAAWHLATDDWPRKRTYQMFRDWFEVELIEMVEDASRDELISEE